MRLRSYKSEAVVLTRRDYSESDRILSVFTRDFGRISLLAKGVRKLKSRKRGHIEVFSLINFQASRSKSGLDLLTEVEIIDNFLTLRQDLKKVSLAYYLMEVVGKITSESEPHKQLFEIILKYLSSLQTSTRLKTLRLNFIQEVVVNLGFWPAGKLLQDPDRLLESILERKINSVRVGKKILT